MDIQLGENGKLTGDDLQRIAGSPITSRFRGVFAENHEVYGPVIVIEERNGGGNREHWGWDDDDPSEGFGCFCTGCVQTYHIPQEPQYLFDEDDDSDSTYCYNFYSVPDPYKELVLQHLSA